MGSRVQESAKNVNLTKEEWTMKREIRDNIMELNWISGQLLFLFLAFFVLVLPSEAADIPYPVKPIRVIAPWGIGSTGDLAPRVIAERMVEFLGQPMIIENKPGGGRDNGNCICGQSKSRWLYGFSCKFKPYASGTNREQKGN